MSLRQIASNLALSVTTVSRALGGHSDVSEATRLRIMREADRIGYVPNEMARRLQKGRADAIGFVIPGGPDAFDDPFFLKIIEGAWSRLEEHDMDLLVMSAPSGSREMKLYRRLVEGRRVDGLIVSRVRDGDERINYLLGAQFPFVTISAGRLDDHRVVSLDIDNAAAFRKALQRLRDLGHRSVACVGPRALRYSALRIEAFHMVSAEMHMNGVEIEADGSIEGGERAVDDLLTQHRGVTALICTNDRIGAGVVRELLRRGLTPGRDISVICFGDGQLTRMITPQLTCLRLPTEQMAIGAVDALIQMRNGLRLGRISDQHAELILRDTDGPCLSRQA
jgi:LacI family transcriptional regulator